MSKEKIMIQFNSLHQLWLFVQEIKVNNVEIRTKDCLLICDCSEEDVRLAEKYNGRKIGQLVGN